MEILTCIGRLYLWDADSCFSFPKSGMNVHGGLAREWSMLACLSLIVASKYWIVMNGCLLWI